MGGFPKCAAAGLAAAFLLALAASAGASDEVVGNCSNDVELRADLAAMQQSGGGVLTFSCGPATILVATVLPEITKPTKIVGSGKITISGGNVSRIFLVTAGGSLELEDLVLTNATAPGDGGAIHSQGSLTLRRVEVKNSVSGQSGGGLTTVGPLLIEDSTFAFNRAVNGGAVYARFPASTVTIVRSVLHDNETTDKLAGKGGAIFLWDGATVSIEETHLHHNSAVTGGAVHNMFANSSVTILDSLLEQNVASSGNPIALRSGGAVYSSGGPLTVKRTVFAGNRAVDYGGGVYVDLGVANVEDSVFRNGQASDSGGGLACNVQCILTMRRTTLWQNEAGNSGGGVDAVDSDITLENVTFAENRSSTSGGGLSAGVSRALLSNCTLVQNEAPTGASVLQASAAPDLRLSLRNTILSGAGPGANCSSSSPAGIVSLDGNLSDDNSCSASLTGLRDRNGPAHDPLLALSASTSPLDPVYIPQPGSPAIDGGIAAGAPTADQRGVARPQGAAHDIGAVEVATCPAGIVCGDATGDGSLAASDALLALRTAVGSGSCPRWRCDFNGDGSITATDALAILRSAVGQNIASNCPQAWDCVPGS